eukprot:162373-Pyramimonas_sp.AAC.1
MPRAPVVPGELVYELMEVDPSIVIIERLQVPHWIVWSVGRVPTDLAEALTELLELVITSRDDVFLPATLHECLVNRTYRWKSP